MSLIINNYKKVESALLEKLPGGHLIAAGVLLLTLVAMLIVHSQPDEDESVDLATAVNNISDEEFAKEETANDNAKGFEIPNVDSMLSTAKVDINQQEITVKSGDNLSMVFARAGLNNHDLYELFDGNKYAKDLRSITPGQKLSFLIDPQGKLQELTYRKDTLTFLKITRSATGFANQEIALTPESKRVFHQGTINSSLYVAGKQAGLPINITMALANIFGWDIDFALGIKKGDSFKVMYEEQYVEGKKIGAGVILSAEFTNAGKIFRAVRYTTKDGSTRYFAEDGKGMNKAFLRTPVDFIRISDAFNLKRLHPILNTIRAHKGTDYAANIGTPIHATGDGKVMFAGREGGYGNFIILQHGQGYETRYGHMNNFAKGITTGSHVTQGQVIGYVGQTGLATGPHLHYEFHVNGQVRDPVTVQLPQSVGIATNEKDRFIAATHTLLAQLDDFGRDSRVAAAEGSTKSN